MAASRTRRGVIRRAGRDSAADTGAASVSPSCNPIVNCKRAAAAASPPARAVPAVVVAVASSCSVSTHCVAVNVSDSLRHGDVAVMPL